MIEDADLRAVLVRFREDHILANGPSDIRSRKHCVLRRAMIDHLIEFKPATPEDWINDLPLQLLRATDPDQVRIYGRTIIALVRRHLRQSGRLSLPELPYMCVDNEPPSEGVSARRRRG